MQKAGAVASLGQRRLMLPVWVKAALAANDRLKLYLTVLQGAWQQASQPAAEPPDLGPELAAAGLNADWLRRWPAAGRRIDDDLVAPELSRLAKALADDLALMARPLLEDAPEDLALQTRVHRWLAALGTLGGERISAAQIESLTHGRRDGSDSLHLLVMDLHKQINGLAADLASENIAGANAWDLQDADRPRVAAFMRGLNRTAGLKFDHPGLDTAATRDGERLLIQNDIGTNDAHVLVLQVQGLAISLTYSDLHRVRLEFFQEMLRPFGARWSGTESRTQADLNAGEAYTVATARFECQDETALQAALEGIGSRIVFLIDWNRARKRLRAFVDKRAAVALLQETARGDIGHRAWLQLGGEQLVFGAMQAAGEGAFRIGDRLDEVIGPADARAFMLSVMRRACDALRNGQPARLVADETRMLLAHHVRQRTGEFDLLAEHAAFCHELAQGLADGLAHGVERSPADAALLATRAKTWERRADHLVMQAREKAERQPRWRPIARLAEQSDNVADALEEAAFLLSLTAEHVPRGFSPELRTVLTRLAQTVLSATQDYVRALEITRSLGAGSDSTDNDAFLGATWRVLQAERQCDVLLREARRRMLGELQQPAALNLASDLAMRLESASDHLLAAGYALRDLAFDKAGTP